MKIAIVGTGNVAKDNYLPFLAKQEGVTLGYFNRSLEKAEAVRKTFGGEVFPDLEGLAAWKPDVAFVLTAETCRYEIGSAVVRSGIGRVLFEKPLVAASGQAHVTEEDFAQGKKLLDLAKAHGCVTAMMFNYRFFDQVVASKKIVAARDFGELINATGLVHYACWSHCLDLIRFFGGNFAQVSALMGTAEHRGQGIVARDTIVGFRMEGRATGTVLGTAGMQWQHPLFELTFTFERGRVHLRDIDGDLEILDGHLRLHERHSVVRDASRWGHYGASFEKALIAYLDSIRQQSPPPVPGEEGLRELQAEAAIRRSATEGRPVDVSQEFPL